MSTTLKPSYRLLSPSSLSLICLLFMSQLAMGQIRIDSTLNFQTDPAKKFSIYIPSGYDAATPNKMMVGFHPLNTNRWDAKSWCDTLIQFAETNDLIMICPDGGPDGAVDDQIDTAFTTVMMANMMDWYNIDSEQVYAMGFSWGGRTTYSYGMRNPDKFAGFLPIGAAITGTDQVNGFLENALNKPFYIVHGGSDSPGVRFTPIVTALGDNFACVETELMPGVGHTIDFPNRNQILSTAFQWIETVICDNVSAVQNPALIESPVVFPNPISRGATLQLPDWEEGKLYTIDGKQVAHTITQTLSIKGLSTGLYFLRGTYRGQSAFTKLIIQ